MATSRNLAVPPWVSGILNLVGAPITDANAKLLEFWAQTENGSNWEAVQPGTGTYAAPGTGVPIYNPFNVIAPPGVAETGTQGDIQVYPSWSQGIAASADLLKQSSFAPLLAAMKQGAPLGTLYNSIDWRSATGTQGGDYMPALTAYVNGQGPGPNSVYSGGATTAYTAVAGTGSSGTGSSSTTAAAQTGGCNASGGWHIGLGVANPGLSGCQLKAIKGGLLVAAGAGVMLFGVALIVISGFAGKGPAAPVIAAAQGYTNQVRRLSGNRTPAPTPQANPSTTRSEYNRFLAQKDREKPSEPFEGPNPPLRSLNVRAERPAA
jgi:hypothetical protein